VSQDDYSRGDESEAERLDRNYGELLQELRVAQTGVQILFAFLLSIAFQQRFAGLSDYDHTLYVITLLLAATAAGLLIAPAAVHRVLFRRHRKDELVGYGAVLTSLGLIALGLAMTCAVMFTLTVVESALFGAVAGALLALLLVITWLALPWRDRSGSPRERGLGSDAGTRRDRPGGDGARP
jgi:hypothetical protein